MRKLISMRKFIASIYTIFFKYNKESKNLLKTKTKNSKTSVSD